MSKDPKQTDQKLHDFVERARENEEKLKLFQGLELQLIDADTLPELLECVINELPETFALEESVLALADQGYEIMRLLKDAGTPAEEIPGLKLLTLDKDLAPLKVHKTKPVLSVYDENEHGWLFKGDIKPIKSVAILVLERRNNIIGALGLGSSKPDRFQEGIGTEFLQRLASVVGICIEGAVNVSRLSRAGITDPLTGIKNRRFLDARMYEEVARARRMREPLAFLFIDIDHFKKVNDVYGHESGDIILQEIAARIQHQLRANDVLARWGGEEFAILLTMVDPIEACLVAERLHHNVTNRSYTLPKDEQVKVTLSIGVSSMISDSPDTTIEETVKILSRRADQALLYAKNRGRNKVVCAEREQLPLDD